MPAVARRPRPPASGPAGSRRRTGPRARASGSRGASGSPGARCRRPRAPPRTSRPASPCRRRGRPRGRGPSPACPAGSRSSRPRSRAPSATTGRSSTTACIRGARRDDWPRRRGIRPADSSGPVRPESPRNDRPARAGPARCGYQPCAARGTSADAATTGATATVEAPAEPRRRASPPAGPARARTRHGLAAGAWPGRARRLHAQHALHDLGLAPVVAAHVGQPALVARAVVHAVERARDAAGQGQRDLRAEARRQVDGVLDVVAPALRERQVARGRGRAP